MVQNSRQTLSPLVLTRGDKVIDTSLRDLSSNDLRSLLTLEACQGASVCQDSSSSTDAADTISWCFRTPLLFDELCINGILTQRYIKLQKVNFTNASQYISKIKWLIIQEQELEQRNLFYRYVTRKLQVRCAAVQETQNEMSLGSSDVSMRCLSHLLSQIWKLCWGCYTT